MRMSMSARVYVYTARLCEGRSTRTRERETEKYATVLGEREREKRSTISAMWREGRRRGGLVEQGREGVRA